MRRALVVAAVVLTACGSSSDGDVALGKSEAKVINGVVDTPPKYDSTILIQTVLSGGMGAGCTGTLITPHVVITARHCVSAYSRSSGFGADYTPSNMYIWYGSEPRGTPDNTVIRIVHNGATRIDDNDFAMLVLKDAATKIPFSPIRLAKPPVKSETVAVAGYGITETDTGSPSVELHKRYRRENLRIAYVGPIPSYYIGANEIVLGESICQGDSGGPVYAQGTKALLAVTSRGGNGQREDPTKPWIGCVGTSAINYFTRVDSFAALIRKTVEEVGEVLWEEGTEKPAQPTIPDPGTLGTACTDGTSCASKICIEWAGSTVCSQECSDSNPCPSGFDCSGGYCTKADPSAPPPEEPPPEQPAAQPTSQTVQSGGCSTSAGSSGDAAGAVAILALALAVTRRRR